MRRELNKYWDSCSRWQVLLLHLVALLPTSAALITAFSHTASQLENGEGVTSLIPQCTYLSLTGKECITCGLSRAFCSITHGNFSQAMTYNSWAWVWFITFVITAIVSAFSLFNYIFRPTTGRSK